MKGQPAQPAPDPLMAAFRAAVRAELEDFKLEILEVIAERPQKKLVGSGELSAALGVSSTQIAKLVRAGLPHVMAGECRRFDVERCIEWLESRKAEAAK